MTPHVALLSQPDTEALKQLAAPMLQSSSPLAQKQVRALPDSEQADSSQHPAFLTSSFVLTSGPISSPWITRLFLRPHTGCGLHAGHTFCLPGRSCLTLTLFTQGPRLLRSQDSKSTPSSAGQHSTFKGIHFSKHTSAFATESCQCQQYNPDLLC